MGDLQDIGQVNYLTEADRLRSLLREWDKPEKRQAMLLAAMEAVNRRNPSSNGANPGGGELYVGSTLLPDDDIASVSLQGLFLVLYDKSLKLAKFYLEKQQDADPESQTIVSSRLPVLCSVTQSINNPGVTMVRDPELRSWFLETVLKAIPLDASIIQSNCSNYQADILPDPLFELLKEGNATLDAEGEKIFHRYAVVTNSFLIRLARILSSWTRMLPSVDLFVNIAVNMQTVWVLKFDDLEAKKGNVES